MKETIELDGHAAAVCPRACRCLHHAKTSHSASHPHNTVACIRSSLPHPPRCGRAHHHASCHLWIGPVHSATGAGAHSAMEDTGAENIWQEDRTFRADTIIIFLDATSILIVSQRECKLDRLKSESEGAANEAPTCAVLMHSPQTSPICQGLEEVSSACEVRY